VLHPQPPFEEVFRARTAISGLGARVAGGRTYRGADRGEGVKTASWFFATGEVDGFCCCAVVAVGWRMPAFGQGWSIGDLSAPPNLLRPRPRWVAVLAGELSVDGGDWPSATTGRAATAGAGEPWLWPPEAVAAVAPGRPGLDGSLDASSFRKGDTNLLISLVRAGGGRGVIAPTWLSAGPPLGAWIVCCDPSQASGRS